MFWLGLVSGVMLTLVVGLTTLVILIFNVGSEE